MKSEEGKGRPDEAFGAVAEAGAAGGGGGGAWERQQLASVRKIQMTTKTTAASQ